MWHVGAAPPIVMARREGRLRGSRRTADTLLRVGAWRARAPPSPTPRGAPPLRADAVVGAEVAREQRGVPLERRREEERGARRVLPLVDRLGRAAADGVGGEGEVLERGVERQRARDRAHTVEGEPQSPVSAAAVEAEVEQRRRVEDHRGEHGGAAALQRVVRRSTFVTVQLFPLSAAASARSRRASTRARRSGCPGARASAARARARRRASARRPDWSVPPVSHRVVPESSSWRTALCGSARATHAAPRAPIRLSVRSTISSRRFWRISQPTTSADSLVRRRSLSASTCVGRGG